ncbi:MAG: SIMPL domain-containing protein [Chloroflexota bacterium]|jgi:hypothetical protein
MSHKKTLMVVGTLAVLVAVMAGALSFRAQPASAAPQQQAGESPRAITVTGYGSAFGAPDIVMLGLGVEIVNTDIVAAMDETTARMNAVTDALKAGGVAAEDIRTDHYSIYQDYGYSPAPMGETPGQPQYRVSVGVTVTVRETETVGELLAAAVQAGANMVNYLQFDIEDRAGLEAEARNLAVADAQSRADLLAAALGLSVGEPLTITEGGNVYPVPGLGGGGAAYAEAAPISQGTLRVDMQVTITFALQ